MTKDCRDKLSSSGKPLKSVRWAANRYRNPHVSQEVNLYYHSSQLLRERGWVGAGNRWCYRESEALTFGKALLESNVVYELLARKYREFGDDIKPFMQEFGVKVRESSERIEAAIKTFNDARGVANSLARRDLKRGQFVTREDLR